MNSDELFNKRLDDFYAILSESDKGKNKIVIPSAELSISTTNTFYTNVKAFLKSVNRQPNHYIKFLTDEMNEKGIAQVSKKLSDGIQFNRKFRRDEGSKINILNKKYINEFVMCNSCKSYSTKLLKIGSIMRLKCATCKKEYTVRDV